MDTHQHGQANHRGRTLNRPVDLLSFWGRARIIQTHRSSQWRPTVASVCLWEPTSPARLEEGDDDAPHSSPGSDDSRYGWFQVSSAVSSSCSIAARRLVGALGALGIRATASTQQPLKVRNTPWGAFLIQNFVFDIRGGG